MLYHSFSILGSTYLIAYKGESYGPVRRLFHLLEIGEAHIIAGMSKDGWVGYDNSIIRFNCKYHQSHAVRAQDLIDLFENESDGWWGNYVPNKNFLGRVVPSRSNPYIKLALHTNPDCVYYDYPGSVALYEGDVLQKYATKICTLCEGPRKVEPVVPEPPVLMVINGVRYIREDTILPVVVEPHICGITILEDGTEFRLIK